MPEEDVVGTEVRAPVTMQTAPSTSTRRFVVFMVPPNGGRLSCAAVRWFSQMQFYYDGRRQLQPLVRLRADDGRSDPSLPRNPRSTRRIRPRTAGLTPAG